MIELGPDFINPDLPLIDVNAFKSISMRVALYNSAYRATLKKSSLCFELLEIKDQILTLDVPSGFCSLKHHVTFELEIEDQLRFAATARVLTFLPQGNERDRAQIYLLQYDKKTWTAVQGIFSARQKQIFEFLKGVKGY